MTNAYYIQTNIICLMLLAGIYMMLRKRRHFFPERQRAFSVLVPLTALVCLSDIFAWTCDGERFRYAREIVIVSNMVYYAAITWVCFAWLNYVEVRVHGKNGSSKKRSLLLSIPAILITVLMVTNPLTDFMFTVDEANVYQRANGVLVHWIVNWAYLAATAIHVVILIMRTKLRIERKQLAPLMWFAILPAIAAAGQMLFYGASLVQCGITLSMVMVLFGTMNDMISNDALTGLNNRRALETYLSEQIKNPDRLFSFLMCDVNKFKQINDTYGHSTGDVALKYIAGVLKRACGACGGALFLCRYGGDEFVVCCVSSDDPSLKKLVSCINEELERFNTEHPQVIPLSISIGRSSGLCRSESDVEKLLVKADEDMYRVKQGK